MCHQTKAKFNRLYGTTKHTVEFGKFGPPVTMISNTDDQEEKTWNIDVESDGYLGSVHFNHSDHENGVQNAGGTQAWDPVEEESGWKTVSVKYTVTEVPQQN